MGQVTAACRGPAFLVDGGGFRADCDAAPMILFGHFPSDLSGNTGLMKRPSGKNNRKSLVNTLMPRY
jgi:hypothetical protein